MSAELGEPQTIALEPWGQLTMLTPRQLFELTDSYLRMFSTPHEGQDDDDDDEPNIEALSHASKPGYFVHPGTLDEDPRHTILYGIYYRSCKLEGQERPFVTLRIGKPNAKFVFPVTLSWDFATVLPIQTHYRRLQSAATELRAQVIAAYCALSEPVQRVLEIDSTEAKVGFTGSVKLTDTHGAIFQACLDWIYNIKFKR